MCSSCGRLAYPHPTAQGEGLAASMIRDSLAEAAEHWDRVMLVGDYPYYRRFGFEKRRAHFSSLIMTEQMTRDEALDRISRPEMDEHFLKKEFEYVAHKLGLTVDELQALFDMPKKTFRDYKNKRDLIGLGSNILRKLGLEKRYFR